MSESYPRPETPAGESGAAGVRNPFGWIALGILLLYAVASLVSGFSARGETTGQERLVTELRSAVVMREMSPRFGDAGLRGLEAKVAPNRKRDAESAAVWVAVRTELRERTTRADLAPALASKRIDLKAIGEAYESPVTKAEALAKVRVLDGRGSLSRLAATHLREAVGLPGARDWIRAAATRYRLLLGIVGVVVVGSVLGWGALLVGAAAGTLPKLGPPDVAHSLPDADRLAVRAAALFASFQGFSILFSALGGPPWVKTVGVGLSMFAAVPLVLRRRPSYEEAVGARTFFGRKVLLGVWAFLLEIPVTLVVALIGGWLFRNLPQNEHPAAQALMNTRDLPTILSLFFLGAVVAPYWEETMFRGLLFPALRRALGSPVTGALLSSFLFACIHPQGPGGWLGLMAFAVCSCVLVGRTRSLVPSMVMHAAHNATLLAIALLMGG